MKGSGQMEIWERNLEVLRQISPQLAQEVSRVRPSGQVEVVTAKNGQPVLRVRGITLHSRYDPTREGEEWAQSQPEGPAGEPLVVFGLGLGYHILPLVAQGRAVTVVEPSLEVMRLTLERVDLRPLLARGGLVREWPGRPPGRAQLAVHQPSVRLQREAAADLRQRWARGADSGPASAPQRAAEGAARRILVISPLSGGTYPIAQYCTRAFIRLGHTAEMLDHAPFHPAYEAMDVIARTPEANVKLKKGLLTVLAQGILAKVAEFDPELVLVLPFAPLDPQLLRTLRGQGRQVAYWFVEDFRVFGFWRELAPEVDHFFVIQEEPFVTELKKIGVRHPVLLPLAADPEVFRPLELTPAEQEEYGSEVSFVGAGYGNRRQVFSALTDLDFKIWGSEWDLTGPLGGHIQRQGARIAPEECVKIFRASRINLNLHSSPFHQGINPEGDYINPRTFDLAAAGAFQLVDIRRQLPRYFVPGEEVAVFRSLAELRELIRYYLDRPEERARMAARARQRLLTEHTYEHRMTRVLAQVFGEGAGQGLPSSSGALEGPSPGVEPLDDWLARVPVEHRGSLEGLAAYIEAGEGELTSPEAILLFLNEFYQGLQRGRL